jgi:hypothetical protein
MTTRERQEQTQKKRNDAQRALDEARNQQHLESQNNRRRSLSAERISEEDPPPSYSETVRQDAARGG